MKKVGLYLDTSVFSHLFHDDTPERKAITQDFFENAVARKTYDVFISDVVIDELTRTKDEKRRLSLLRVIANYEIPLLGYNYEDPDFVHLVQLYIDQGVIPKNKLEDALHIAIATIHEIDCLITWNYRHMANINKESMIMSINISQGYYKPLRLITPLEVTNP